MQHTALSIRPEQTGHPPGSVIVIGGGASGVLMAVHLLRADPSVHVTLIERDGLLGCGVAYGTRDPNHLLNTRVSSMSAFPDDPGHFLGWLKERGEPEACPFAFVGRGLYGRYMADLLTPWQSDPRLTCRAADCVEIGEETSAVRAVLADGGTLVADRAVLATGHLLPSARVPGTEALTQPWSGAPPPAPTGRVLIVGSGLTMVDQVLTLLAAGHRGEIVVVSRRGLVPRVHADVAPDPVDRADLPETARTRTLMRWLRARVRAAEAAGGDWRAVVDGLRPHVQRLWRSLPDDERARFLRHACAFWEVHRHRMPPRSAQALDAALTSGQLTLRKAAFLDAAPGADGAILARLRPSGSDTVEEVTAARVIDCRGIRRDPATNAAPPISALLAGGRARIDSLRLGIDTDRHCRVIDAYGKPSDRLYAIGPVSRAAFWEITAIPDIRDQVARLAAKIAAER